MSFAQRHLLHFFLLWAFLVLVVSLCYATVPQAAWHDELLPFSVRLGVFAFELLLLAPIAFVATLPTALHDAGGNQDRRSEGLVSESATRRVARRLLHWAIGIAFLLLFLFYIGSWGVFRSTGHFLGATGLSLWFQNGIQVFQHAAHMEPESILLFPLLVLILAGGALLLLYHVSGRIPLRFSRAVAKRGMFFILPLPVVLGFLFHQQPRFMNLGIGRAGPVSSALFEIRRHLQTADDPMRAISSPVTDRRLLVSMESYIAVADTAGIDRPNVIVMIVESLRPDQLRAFGGSRSAMPTVDSLARNGRVFTNNYTQASHSDYADPSLLSSHYPLRSARYSFYPEDPKYPRVLIYDVLKALGYRTAIISSQNEHWSGMIHYLQTGNIDFLLHSDNYNGPTYVPRDDAAFYRFAKQTKRAGKIDDRFTVREAIKWIDQDKEIPFFLYTNLQNSHMPYELPADFQPRFGTGEVDFPFRFGYFPPDRVEAVKDLYANSLAYVDAQIAELIAFLEQHGLLDRTIVVITGDTGQAFYEHGFTAHGGPLYEEVVSVPLLFHGPRVPTGPDSLPAQHIDVPPSILDLLGLPPHPSFQGVSLFSGEIPPERPRFMVGHVTANQYATVSGCHKLIYDVVEREHLLYDLCSDPGETMDIASGNPDLVERLALLLHAWRKTQIEYYQDWSAQRRWYPPNLVIDDLLSPDTLTGAASR